MLLAKRRKMVKPRSAEYDIGPDAYGRRVILRYERGDRDMFEIHITAGGQLDVDQRVAGLTAGNLSALAEIVSPEVASSNDDETQPFDLIEFNRGRVVEQ